MGSFLARLRAGLAVFCAAFLIFAPAFAGGSGARTAAGHSGQGVLNVAEDAWERVRIEGLVLLPGGEPACGAVVVSSAGGQASTGEDGSFALEIALAPGAQAVELTAVASSGGGTQSAHRRVDALGGTGVRDAGTLVLAPAEGCALDWIPTFGEQAGLNGDPTALAVFDDGSGAGPALYAGGYFTQAGAKTVKHIARWDGEHWSPLGGGLNAGVFALAVFDDGSGSGPALYAGGIFGLAGGLPAKNVARWDGRSWSALGEGVNGYVSALTVHDDGSGFGPALYAGGAFGKAGGFPASCIARWNGEHWSPLGSGVNNPVRALCVFDDGAGGGPGLYAGGDFKSAGSVGVNYIARWDGRGWSSLANGMDREVRALAVFDDGSGGGPALYAGGDFTSAGGQDAKHVARWDGRTWSALGSGLGQEGSNVVRELTVFDDGSGPALYAGGAFHAPGEPAWVARWDGAEWNALPGAVGEEVDAMAVFDEGSGGGPVLFVGNQMPTQLAKWDGRSWSSVGTGLDGAVRALAVFDDGSGAGPALYAGGEFTLIGGVAQAFIARWDGHAWSSVGGGVDGVVRALSVFDDGSGSALIAGGDFSKAGGTAASAIARWDGRQWHPLGVGFYGSVRALAVFDDGSGPALHAGGLLYAVPSSAPLHIAKWDGQVWSAVGGGADTWVLALAVFDDGSGPALYAGGHFTSIGGGPARYIARWDGLSWSEVSSGVNDWVLTLAVHDDRSGAGPALYAGGHFTSAGIQDARSIAKWDGQSWGKLGSGTNGWVETLTGFDDGSGPALYAGGFFTLAGGVSAKNIARWGGQAWGPLGSGMSDRVLTSAAFDDGSGPALYAGGVFKQSPAGDSYLAHWGCPATITTVPGCSGNPAALVSLSDEAALGNAFSVSLSASQLATGFGLLYLGAEGTDASGCGVLATGLGELVLALLPPPAQVGAGHLSSGEVTFALQVPDDAALAGIEVAFQGVVVGVFDPGIPIELSNGLLVTLAQ